MDVSTMSLADFINEFSDVLKAQLLDNMQPVYQPSNEDDWDRLTKEKLKGLLRQPFEAQLHKGILPLAKAFYKHKERAGILVGEMGVGKTLMGLAVASLYPSQHKRILIQCPGHLVEKWIREAKETIPDCTRINLNNRGLGKLLELKQYPQPPVGTEVYVIGKERAKLHFQKKSGWLLDRQGNPLCADCKAEILPVDAKKKPKCPECNTPLWQADGKKTRRYAKAEFIKRFLPAGFFDVLLLDEVHELKGGATAQGQAMHCLISSSKKVLALTGTLNGGYSKDLFFLLWRLFSAEMKKLGILYGKTQAFAERYGCLEQIYRQREGSYNIASIGGSTNRVAIKEIPGISPLLLPDILLSKCAFVRLNDISADLPKYDEVVVSVDMEDEQKDAYVHLETDLVGECRRALGRGDHRLLGKMVQSLLAYPDCCRREETVTLERRVQTEEGYETQLDVVAHAPAIEADILPKEDRLLEILELEKAEGRKVAIFLEHTGTRDLIPILCEKIKDRGLNPLILRSNAVKPDKREKWLQDKISTGDYDCLICNPRIVQTGLDLLDFPTIVFFQTGYSIFTLRQASRRSWRIGQDRSVKIFYLSYSDTMQSKALSLIAQKMQTALAVEGELSDRGLAALSESENSILYEMARVLAGEEKTDSVEDAWNVYKQREIQAQLNINDPDPEVSSTTTVRTTTTISTPDTETSITHEHIIIRGRIYKQSNGAVAVVGGHRFNLSKGLVSWSGRQVGFYNRHGSGVINNKPIKIFKPKDRSYFVLAEIRKEVKKAA